MAKESKAGVDGQMTLMEHLGELRTRIFICAIAVVVCATVVFIFFGPILSFLEEPYKDVTAGVGQCPADGCELIATDPLAPFMVRLKVAGYGGLALALPVVMWEIWRFVVPALSSNEKKYAIPFMTAVILLFLMGAAVAWISLVKALDFLLVSASGVEIQPLVTADKYLTLITMMLLAFGIAFEFPVLLVFLLLVGAVSTATLRKNRRWALLAIFVISAVITPSQDPFSLFFMAVPLYVFYELSILIGRVMKR